MPSKKYHLGLASTSILSMLVLAAAPVGAQHGADSSSSSGGGGSTSTTTTSAPTPTTPTTPPTSGGGSGSGGGSKSGSGQGGSSSGATTVKSHSETETEVSKSSDSATTELELEHSKTMLHTDAQKLLDAKRQENKTQRTPEEKAKACLAHQDEINTRSKNYATQAQKHLDTFNGIFTKVQAFQTTKQLPVANYDALVAAATARQSAAQTAVDTLKVVNVSIDCTATDPASSVATLKTAVAAARTALKEYRQSIKDIVVALKAAAPASTDSTSDTSTSTTGGNQ